MTGAGPPLTVTSGGSFVSGSPFSVEIEPIFSETGSLMFAVETLGRVEVRKCSGALALVGQYGPVAKHWAA